jgi:hypothetical protein
MKLLTVMKLSGACCHFFLPRSKFPLNIFFIAELQTEVAGVTHCIM